MIFKKQPLYFFIILFSSLVFFSCNNKEEKKLETEIPVSIIDYQEIMDRGKLVVLSDNSSISYFIYRGEKMGFEYEILKEFSKEMGLDLEIKIVSNLDNLIPMLENKEGDIIASNFAITKDRKKQINFSIPHFQSAQVLVQRKNDGWEKLRPEDIEKQLIRNQLDLKNKHIHVRKKSSYFQRLVHLQDEMGDSIHIDQVSGLMGTEELIEQVALGIIDYTIARENIAKINSRFYENIDILTPISLNQNIAFGLRKESTLLKAKLDKWLESFMQSKTYQFIYKKYYLTGVNGMNPNNHYSSLGRGKISQYDEIFKTAGKKYNTDWLLLASIAYQESKFNPYIEGFGGAYGMMQFMPNTGPKYGVYPDSPAEVQIHGGMKKIASDINSWSNIPDEEQRIKFALASYNAGRGHIEDAQKLAIKHGLNGNIWDNNVEKMILNLSKQEYYKDEVVKNGAMKGMTTYNYVQKVYTRYIEWKSTYK